MLLKLHVLFDNFIFRLPMQGKTRTEWIEEISRYQEHDFYGYFILCEHHFKREDFIKEDGEKNLQIGVLPSIFPEPNSQDIYDEPSGTNFHGTEEKIMPTTESVNAMGRKPVCKNCTELNMNLMKAKKTISLLQRKVLTQKKAIDVNKRMLTAMQNEIANLKTKKEVREVYLNNNKSIVYMCIFWPIVLLK